MDNRIISKSYKLFIHINSIILVLIAVICLLPIIHILAVSLSEQGPANANKVGLIPIGVNFRAFFEAINDRRFTLSFIKSVERVLIGVSFNMAVTILCAYPLAMNKKEFPGRDKYMWFILFTMLFSGGLIPLFILVNQLNLMDSIWALVLPGAVPVFHVIILMNYFRQLPNEMKEAAFIDGAGYSSILLRIFLPLSKPVIVTLILFCFVNHWNSWFDGMIFMNDINLYPLQTYLQTLLSRMNVSPNLEEARRLALISRRSLLFANVFMAIVPIMIVYPSLLKYYQSGIVIGSVKG